jgi:hypothetical protein
VIKIGGKGFKMASKDWKKETFGKGAGITYQNRKRKDYFIQVFYDMSHSSPWRTVVHADGRVIDEYNSLNRESAILKSKLYMKKH